MKKVTSVILCFALLLFLSGCAGGGEPGPDPEYQDYALEILGLATGEEKISLADIYKLDSVEVKLSNISSSGEIAHLNIKGVMLDEVLSPYGVKQRDYNGIRFYAGDGYSIVVPREMLQNKEIILFYEAEGAPMKEKHRPLRVGINEERSMYWVGNLTGMELISVELTTVKRIVFLETAFQQLEQHDYPDYDQVEKAVKTEDLLEKFSGDEAADQVRIKSADGLDKNEAEAIFRLGYLKITGEGQPMFLSPDLPKGMYVKDVLFFSYGETAWVSMEQLFQKYEDEVENGGIRVKTILDALGLPASADYLFTSCGGEAMVAGQEAIIFPTEGGYSLEDGDKLLREIICLEATGE